MPKIHYMVTEDYVSNWEPKHALRELVANGIDAEISNGATLNVVHDGRKQTLRIRNERTRLDPKALYFGGGNKNDTRLIGQYGEGLKIAMLVLARSGIPLKIHNNNEEWKASIETDERGIRVLTLNTRESRNKDDSVEVEVGNVTNDAWYELRDMFLRLLPPIKKADTESGSILFDYDRVGKLYVKGVYVGRLARSAFGYDIKELDIGRDRISFVEADVQTIIAQMWEECATNTPDTLRALYQAFKNATADLAAFGWTNKATVATAMLEFFQGEYGENAYPLGDGGEGDANEIKSFGKVPVATPASLTSVLLSVLPGVYSMRQEQGRGLKHEYAVSDLSPSGALNLSNAIRWLQEVGVDEDVAGCVKVVDFNNTQLRSLRKEGNVLLSSVVLAKFEEVLWELLTQFSRKKAEKDRRWNSEPVTGEVVMSVFSLMHQELAALKPGKA